MNGLFVGLWLGIAVARFRDVQPFVNSILGVIIFFTPVFSTSTTLSSRIQNVLLAWNPFTYLIEAFRAPLIGAPLASVLLHRNSRRDRDQRRPRPGRVHARPVTASILGGVMAQISLGKVRAQYELLSVLDYNLKRRVVETIRRKAVPPVTIDALSGIDLEVSGRLPARTRRGKRRRQVDAALDHGGCAAADEWERRGARSVLALLGGAVEGLDQEATGARQRRESRRAARRDACRDAGRIDDVTEFSGLGARIDHPVYSYSTGMQTRLRFSILTSLRPDILLLDEGLGTADAEFAQRADERLREFMSSAGIVVLASHGDDLLRSQCDTAVWLDQGRVREQGDLDEVLMNYHASYTQSPPQPDWASA